jgi:hypothetical protein
MERAAQHIYTQYIESTEHETANQSIYDEARAHASDRLKDLIREGMETEAEATMIEAMAGGHMQGFIEGFMYASKLWAETTTEDWSRSRSSAGPYDQGRATRRSRMAVKRREEHETTNTRPRPKEGQGGAMVKRGGHPESRGHPRRS